MSENIPESIPTSADPRSKRPLKKRALSPRSHVAAQLDALFTKPDQEIHIPQSNTVARVQAMAPEIVANVQGSSAGAGSGEFHVYKASRRREYERLRAMDEEVKKEEENEQWERKRAERESRDEEKTRKNRMKREKLKARKAGKPQLNSPSYTGFEVGKQHTGATTPAKGESSCVDPNQRYEAQEIEPQGLLIHDED